MRYLLSIFLFASLHSFCQQNYIVYKKVKLQVGESFKLGNFTGKLEIVEKIDNVEGFSLTENDAAAQMKISLVCKNDTNFIKPIFVVKDREIFSNINYNQKLKIGSQFTKIKPEKATFYVTFLTLNGKKPICVE